MTMTFFASFLLPCWTLLMMLAAADSQTQDPDPQCTNTRSGLPSCNFDATNCFSEPKDSEPAWNYVEDPDTDITKPVEPYQKRYVYLDPAKSKGKARKLIGQISKGKKAICVDFYYATAGNSTVPVNIYIQDDAQYSPVHRVLANTGGKWESTSFSCCLPQQEQTVFAIEATSTADGIPAIDYVDVRESNMPCGNGKLVCYPSPPGRPPLDPITAPKCPSDQVEAAVPSCEFKADDQKNLHTCGWEVSSAWEVRQQIDGSGQYDVISSTSKDNATLTSSISDDATSFCVEIQFTVPDVKEDLRNAFYVNIVSDNGTVTWGESYNYREKDGTIWKRNSFQAPVQQAKNRKIQILSNKEGLEIDYIHVRAYTPPPPPPTQAPEDPKKGTVVFRCPVISDSLVAPLCGMDAVPSQDPGSDQGWIENEPEDSSKTIFPGKSHYLLYKGSELILNNTPASLTIVVMQIYHSSMISFSYALSGNATVEVCAKDEMQREVLVWRTESETGHKWERFKGPIGKTGDVQVMFKVVPPEIPTNQPVYVGLTDILIWVLPKAPGPDSQCTYQRRGVPACNFNIVQCYSEPDSCEPAWIHVKDSDTVDGKPVKPYEKGYVYLDPAKSQGLARTMTGRILGDVKAICVEFYYATAGNSTVPINIYLQDGGSYTPVHRVLANTRGEWESTSFSCCLPKQNMTNIAIESRSTSDGIPAIDYIDIRISDMSCEDGTLVCYPA